MASRIDADSPINDYLSFKISVLYRLMVRRTARFLNSNYDLSVAEWWTLAQLAVKSPGTVSGIVELTQNDKSQVSRSVTTLIQKGLVRKEDNPEDRRSSLLYLTEQGQTHYQEILPMRQRTQALLLQQLMPKEAEVAERAIEKLTSFLLENPDLVVAAE